MFGTHYSNSCFRNAVETNKKYVSRGTIRKYIYIYYCIARIPAHDDVSRITGREKERETVVFLSPSCIYCETNPLLFRFSSVSKSRNFRPRCNLTLYVSFPIHPKRILVYAVCEYIQPRSQLPTSWNWYACLSNRILQLFRTYIHILCLRRRPRFKLYRVPPPPLYKEKKKHFFYSTSIYLLRWLNLYVEYIKTTFIHFTLFFFALIS